MLEFLSRRVRDAIPVILGVATLVFLLIHFIPGDPVDLMLGDSATVAEKAALRMRLGLDLPLWRQYFSFWHSVLFEGWGESLVWRRSVLDLVWERFPATCLLAFTSLSLALLISIPLGVLAARFAGSWIDALATGSALFGLSLPSFVLAPFLVLLFSIRLRWLPVAGGETGWHLVLPSLCLGFGLSGLLTRMVRASVLECLNEDYVRTARAKGLGELRVLFGHALSNGLIPVVTILGNMLGGLLAGAVLTETIFDWPGLGRLFYGAFQGRDYPLIQGVVLWTALSYVVISIIVDLVYARLDPRIRLIHRSGGNR